MIEILWALRTCSLTCGLSAQSFFFRDLSLSLRVFLASQALRDAVGRLQSCVRAEVSGHRGGPLLALLHTNGIDTFAGLAYACGTPQKKVPDATFDQFAEKVAGPNPSMGLKSQLRRLMFESSTYVIARLKQAVTADETPNKLPVAERKARQSAQAARLVGVLSEKMVPSYELVDLTAEIVTTNCIAWIGPGKCTSRESEIQRARKDLTKVIRCSRRVRVKAPKPILLLP